MYQSVIYILSGIRNLIMSEEIIVNPPMKKMAYSTPNKSAVIPEITAPKAYPKSLQSRNVPILSARCFGLVAWAIVVRKVGYTNAVPRPNIVRSIPIIPPTKAFTITNKVNCFQFSLSPRLIFLDTYIFDNKNKFLRSLKQ